MGVLIKSSSLAAIMHRSKWQPIRVMRFLMDELFTTDELRSSTVHGKRGTLPPLDEETMDAILCKNNLYMYVIYTYANLLLHLGFTMAKAEEWGQLTTEEALVRQANEKCYQYRCKRQM